MILLFSFFYFKFNVHHFVPQLLLLFHRLPYPTIIVLNSHKLRIFHNILKIIFLLYNNLKIIIIIIIIK